jgi:hypothetical protein
MYKNMYKEGTMSHKVKIVEHTLLIAKYLKLLKWNNEVKANASHSYVSEPLLTHGSESWPLTRKDKNMLRIFERRILRKMYRPIKENNT